MYVAKCFIDFHFCRKIQLWSLRHASEFSDENESRWSILQHTYVDSVFCADFKYSIFSITSLTIQEKIDRKSVKKKFFVSYSLFLLCFQYYSIVWNFMKYHRIIEHDLGYRNIQRKNCLKPSVKYYRVGATTFGMP